MRFVGDVEHPILASVLGAVFDKVVGPDIVALLRPQRMHEPSASQSLPRLGCSWDQPLTLPDTLDPLIVDYPARLAQGSAS